MHMFKHIKIKYLRQYNVPMFQVIKRFAVKYAVKTAINILNVYGMVSRTYFYCIGKIKFENRNSIIYDIDLVDLNTFLPLPSDEFEKTNIQIHYLGYYLKWVPQEAYYYAVEHTNFQARPYRSQGTYSKYNSIDDKNVWSNINCSWRRYRVLLVTI